MKNHVQFAFVSTVKDKKFIGQDVGIFFTNNACQIGLGKNRVAQCAEATHFEVLIAKMNFIESYPSIKMLNILKIYKSVLSSIEIP